MKGFATINHNGSSMQVPQSQADRMYAGNIICKVIGREAYQCVPPYSLRNVDLWLDRQDSFQLLIDHMRALGWAELDTGEIGSPEDEAAFPNWLEAIKSCIEVATGA